MTDKMTRSEAMNEADRKAFEEWADSAGYDPGYYSRNPLEYPNSLLQMAERAWFAARDHYRKDVAELVEAVEKQSKLHAIDVSMGRLTPGKIEAHGDFCEACANVAKLAAKLKEQP